MDKGISSPLRGVANRLKYPYHKITFDNMSCSFKAQYSWRFAGKKVVATMLRARGPSGLIERRGITRELVRAGAVRSKQEAREKDHEETTRFN